MTWDRDETLRRIAAAKAETEHTHPTEADEPDVSPSVVGARMFARATAYALPTAEATDPAEVGARIYRRATRRTH